MSMNLDISKWHDFKVQDIFSRIEYGKNSYAIDLDDGHDCIYVGAKKDDNGFMKWCKKDADLISKGNCIVFIVDGKGSVGYCNYMDRDFIATANLKLGYCNELNRYNGLFISTILCKERFRYSFGRKWKKFVNDTIIKLPAISNDDGTCVPDWQFMEDYIKSLHYKPLTTKNLQSNFCFNVTNWKFFKVGNLFKIDLSKGDIKADDSIDGDIPLVSSGETNNGIVKYIDKEGDGKAEIFEGNKITVDMFGNAFYQSEKFYAVSHGRVNILSSKFELNKFIGIFIATIIKNEQFKYSYGRAVYSNVVADMIIKLPIKHNLDGTPFIDTNKTYSEEGYVPDWQFMEEYIKSLPYGDRI